MTWLQKLERQLSGGKKRGENWRSGDPAPTLLRGIPLLVSARVPPQRDELAEAPFDRHLLSASPLYCRSRRRYLENGGRFRATLVSSPRTLSSSILLENVVEYSPIARELSWSATDREQRKEPTHLLSIRSYAAALFHEQNHRLLWRFLPPSPREGEGCCRYLDFAEAIVVATDMALGDLIGGNVAELFYLSGATYDAGTRLRKEVALNRRQYRNYLHAALFATYLNLQFFDAKDIERAIPRLFPELGPLAARACRRALALDRAFVDYTNPMWQEIHGKDAARALSSRRGAPLELPARGADNRLHYLWAEKWFSWIGL